MTRRANPHPALKASSRELRKSLSAKIVGPRAEEVRTTYSVGTDARQALRTLAVITDCKIKDLVAIAIEDLAIKHGTLSVEKDED
jgi:hypothetical protein